MIHIEDWGRTEYESALQRQRTLFEEMTRIKKNEEELKQEYLIFTEHSDVITLGKHAKSENLIKSPEFYSSKKINCIKIERGGDVTFHGPGQLVVYPLIDLKKHGLGVKSYVHLLEEAVIQLISLYGIDGYRIENATGVWVKDKNGIEKKICAIGVKCSRFCTMHGLALNINTDLNKFAYINPCGFVDKGVTSLNELTGEEVDMSNVKKQLSMILLSLMGAL